MLFLLLLGISLAWFLSLRLYARCWHRGLSVILSFTERFLYAGDTSTLKETVTNDKLLPLPALEVRFAADRGLEFTGQARANSGTSDQLYKRDVFSFLFHQRTLRTLSFIATKRGCYPIANCSVVGYDFLFHSSYYREFPQQTTLYVYPRQIDTERIFLLYQTVSGEILAKSRLHPDPFAFSGIRDYTRSDPMHHINWKASARTGSLMVNQFDSTTDIALTLLFDLEDTHILKYEELLEETLSIVSSLAARLISARMALNVLGNAADPVTGEAFSLSLNTGQTSTAELNQRLACVDITRTMFSGRELLEGEINHRKTGHTYILISKNRDTGLVPALQMLAGTDSRVIWVLPLLPADLTSLTLPHDPAVAVLPWELT